MVSAGSEVVVEFSIRGPEDHINKRILHTMIFGIPGILGLGTRM